MIADSKDMALAEITAWLVEQAQTNAIVVRLQTGDPALFGALIEVTQPLDAAGVDVGVVPGVCRRGGGGGVAAAGRCRRDVTLPEFTKDV